MRCVGAPALNAYTYLFVADLPASVSPLHCPETPPKTNYIGALEPPMHTKMPKTEEWNPTTRWVNLAFMIV